MVLWHILNFGNSKCLSYMAESWGRGGWFFYEMPLNCVFYVLSCWFVSVRGWAVCQKGWMSQIWHSRYLCRMNAGITLLSDCFCWECPRSLLQKGTGRKLDGLFLCGWSGHLNTGVKYEMNETNCVHAFTLPWEMRELGWRDSINFSRLAKGLDLSIWSWEPPPWSRM